MWNANIINPFGVLMDKSIEEKIIIFGVRKSLPILVEDHRSWFYLILSFTLIILQISLLSACSLVISANQKSITDRTPMAVDGSSPAPTPSRIHLPSSTPSPSQTASPTYTPRPTITATTTPTPSPTIPTATPRFRADITFSKSVADAGNFVLQAGETVIITWENAPAGAIRYEFHFIHADDDSDELIGEDYDDSQGVYIYWWVPAHLEGNIGVTAYFPDGRMISDLWGETIWSGSYPPQGVCSMSSASVGVVQVFPSPNMNQPQIGYLEPGSYAQVLERYVNGWYHISTSEVFFPPSQSQRPGHAWVHERESFFLHGLCDELPLK
jgi:hypothetical protein